MNADNKALQDVEDLRWLLASPAGRRVIISLLNRCGLDRQSYTGTPDTYFREGQRNVGLGFQADLKAADKRGYLQMLAEQLDDN